MELKQLEKYYYAPFIAVGLLFFFIAPDFGISGDEFWHVYQGERIIDWFSSGFENEKCLDTADPTVDNLIYYGQSVDTIASMIGRILPGVDIYSIRHILNSWIGLLGIFFAFLIAKEIGGWRAAIVCAVIFLCSPRYIGHIMNNLKDGAFASLYIISTWGIIYYFKTWKEAGWKQILILGLITGLPFSVRVGGLLNMIYLLMFAGLFWIWGNRKELFGKKSIAEFSTHFKYLAPVLAISYFVGILLWPFAWQDPFVNPFKSLTEFSDFYVSINQVFDGQVISSSNLPWYYMFRWMWLTIPVVALAGLFLSPLAIWREKENYHLFFTSIVVFAMVFPIAYILYKESNIYGGWRHVLFTYPSMVILAGLGWEGLMRMLPSKAANYAIYGLIAIGCLSPLQWMVRNHPHQYTWFNELSGGLKANYGQYETDYYLNSLTMCTDWFRENEMPKLPDDPKTIVRSNKDHIIIYHFRNDTGKIAPNYQKYRSRSDQDWDYYIHTAGYIEPEMLRNGAWPPKGCIYIEEAAGVPLGAVLKRVSKEDYYGFQAMRNGHVDSAIAHWNRYLAIDEKNEQVMAAMGNAFLAKQDGQNAYDFATRALALNPVEGTALNTYLRLALANVRANEILAYFNRLAKEREFDHNGYMFLGMYYQNAQDMNRAAHFFEKAWLASENQRVFNPLLETLRASGQTAKFNSYVEVAREMGWIQ